MFASTNWIELGDVVQVTDEPEARHDFMMAFGAETSTGPYRVQGTSINFLVLKDETGKKFTTYRRFFVKTPASPDLAIKPGIFVTIIATNRRARVIAVNAESREVSLLGYGRFPINQVRAD